jgi:hypothetical protein
MSLRQRLRRLEDRASNADERQYTPREWLSILEDAEQEVSKEIFDFSEWLQRLRVAVGAKAGEALTACLDRVRWFVLGMGFTRAEWAETRCWILAAWQDPTHPAHDMEVPDRPEGATRLVRLSHLYHAVHASEELPVRGAGEIVWAAREFRSRRGAADAPRALPD